MDNMEFNKIFAAILCAGIVAMLSGFVADKLYHPKKLKKNAVTIEVADAGGATIAKKPQVAAPMMHLIASADLARGAKLAKACAACHSFDEGGPNGVGPNLWAIVGANKAAKDGYAYSDAIKNAANPKWDYASLNQFLWKPKKYLPGTKMNYIGLKKPSDRAAIIAWMREKGSSGYALPSDADAAAEAAWYQEETGIVPEAE